MIEPTALESTALEEARLATLVGHIVYLGLSLVYHAALASRVLVWIFRSARGALCLMLIRLFGCALRAARLDANFSKFTLFSHKITSAWHL